MNTLQLITDIRYATRKLLLALLVLNIAFIGLTAVRGYPTWWLRFMGETNMWTRGTALELLASSAVCAAVFWLRRYQESRGLSTAPMVYLWLAAASAFAYLALDELLMIHERLEGIYGVNDSYAILTYIVGAIALCFLLSADLRKSQGAIRLFAAAIGLMVISTFIDRFTSTRGPLMAFEEILELLAAYLFLASFILVLARTVTQILTSIHTSFGSADDSSAAESSAQFTCQTRK